MTMRLGERLATQTPPRRQAGISLVLMALSLVMLLSFTALALDGSNLYIARNELQNAADAGALAGARVLYVADGSSVNSGADAVAAATAASNASQGTAVEVTSVRRGHWSFATRTFTPNSSLDPVDLFGVSAAELDADPNFINAVEVVTERNATAVPAFFGFIFGHESYQAAARAVAYIGFAGTLRPEDVDQPVAICKDRLLSGGEYVCSVGTFIPSSSDELTSETGGWSSFSQDDACLGGTSTSELRPLVCASGNPMPMTLGKDVATHGGQSEATFKDLYDCWDENTGQEELWNMTLPVIDCPDANVGPCNRLSGAVNVNVVFVVDQANKIDDDAPRRMELPDFDGDGASDGIWENDSPDGATRWNDFVTTFNIQKPDGTLALWDSDPSTTGWRQKTIYFLPDCSFHEPTGLSGGENFGVLAQIPVLVD